jgi:uncharacterized protein
VAVLATVKEGEGEQRQAREHFEREVGDLHRDPDAWKRSHPYDPSSQRQRSDDDRYRHKKKKKFDLFDIFD